MIAAHPEGVVEANLEVSELMGAETYLYLDCEGHPLVARVSPDSTDRPGDRIKVAIETAKIHLFDKDTEMVITN